MASIVIRLLVLILILWLLQRLLVKVLGAARQSGAQPKDAGAPNRMVKDPVCGMYLDSRVAVRLDNSKEPFFFCSEECMKKYLGQSARGSEAGTHARG